MHLYYGIQSACNSQAIFNQLHSKTICYESTGLAQGKVQLIVIDLIAFCKGMYHVLKTGNDISEQTNISNNNNS